MSDMRRACIILCVVLLTTFWLPGVRCTASDKKVTVHFTNEKGSVVRKKEYRMTSRMFEVSKYMRNAMERMGRDRNDHIEVTCDKYIFDKTVRVLDNLSLDRVSVDDITGILDLLDCLEIGEDSMIECSTYMARKTMEMHEDCDSFTERILEGCYKYIAGRARGPCGGTRKSLSCFIGEIMPMFRNKRLRSMQIYALQLLREWAGMHGMRVAISKKKATLCTWEYHRAHRDCGSTDKVSVLREMVVQGDEDLRTHKLHPVVFRLLEMVASVMDIPSIDVSIVCWRSVDSNVIEEIKKINKLGRRVISCRIIGQREIQGYFQELKGNIVKSSVSSNMLNDADWKTVREMATLKRLDITGCAIKLEMISTHLKELQKHLVELDVSWNKLSDDDWKTMGEMRALKRLYITSCDIEPGTVSRHFQGMKKHLVELDVSWNRKLSDADWKTVGEMATLKRLDITSCDIEPGTVSRHFQGMKKHLVELDVSWNKLSSEDWKTVGEIRSLRILKIDCCRVEPETVSTHFLELKKHLVDLDVSWNKLSDDDWKTVGEMRILKRLYITGCEIKSGTVSRHLQRLKRHLEELDVSWNRELSSEDWMTVGEMRALKRLDITGCFISTEVRSKYLGRLKDCQIIHRGP